MLLSLVLSAAIVTVAPIEEALVTRPLILRAEVFVSPSMRPPELADPQPVPSPAKPEPCVRPRRDTAAQGLRAAARALVEIARIASH
jgi:hypothetical protein